MCPGFLKCREPPQVWIENIYLAEDTGLLIRDPGWVEVNGVLWRKEVPALPTHRNITVIYDFRLKERQNIFIRN